MEKAIPYIGLGRNLRFHLPSSSSTRTKRENEKEREKNAKKILLFTVKDLVACVDLVTGEFTISETDELEEGGNRYTCSLVPTGFDGLYITGRYRKLFIIIII